MRRVPGFMLAAPKSGSGKTALACALIELMKRSGQRTAAFKCGPDFIDPMFHRQVLGVPSYNLDTFFLGTDGAAELFSKHAAEADISLIEGVMGYFDGLGGRALTASSYETACAAGVPVILVVDAKGMSRSVVPLLKGFSAYEKEKHIRGVILNRANPGTFRILKPMIEEETGLAVCGYAPASPHADWGSRHLGLTQPEEIPAIREKIARFASELSETVDLSAVLKIAEERTARTEGEDRPGKRRDAEDEVRSFCCGSACFGTRPVRIAAARDEAFTFYYEDNLDLLREMGAELIFFSPLHDAALPEADGLIFGGGYPELHAKQLSENTGMLESIRNAAARKMPVLAECGGFLYLQQSFGGCPMAGVLPGEGALTDRLVRFGYVTVTAERAAAEGFLRPGETVRGHEFHYADSTANGTDCTAKKPSGDRQWPCMVMTERILAGFPHLYYRSEPRVAARFLAAAAAYRSERGRPDETFAHGCRKSPPAPH